MLADLLRSSRPSLAGTSSAPPLSRSSLAGTVAIVTGGDSPLARALGLCLAHNGADLVLLYRHEHGAARESLRRMRAQGARAVALYGDPSDPELGRQVVEATLAHLGHADAMRAEAGARPGTPLPQSADTTIAGFGAALRERLAAHQVQLKSMTRGPIWHPLVPADPDTELPVNQHQGNTGPCFVFVARDDPAPWARASRGSVYSTA